MAIHKGDDVILKVGDGATPTEVFTDVGGVINTSFKLDNEIIEANNLSAGAYRQINAQSGIKNLVIRFDGYFTDSSAEELMRRYAFSAASSNYELHFGNGDKISGAFFISSYERVGNLGSQEDFVVVLENSGDVTFTVGA